MIPYISSSAHIDKFTKKEGQCNIPRHSDIKCRTCNFQSEVPKVCISIKSRTKLTTQMRLTFLTVQKSQLKSHGFGCDSFFASLFSAGFAIVLVALSSAELSSQVQTFVSNYLTKAQKIYRSLFATRCSVKPDMSSSDNILILIQIRKNWGRFFPRFGL